MSGQHRLQASETASESESTTASPSPTESGTPSYPVWSTAQPGSYGGGDPNGTVFMPAESDTTMSTQDVWFWKPVYSYRSLADLKSVYLATVGQNSQLLLNIAPNATGLVPDEAVAIYSQFGAWVQSCYGAGIELASTSGSGLSMTIALPFSQIVDRVVLQEDQSGGEQVWAYSIEVQDGGGPAPWQLVGTGSAVGHKRIHVLSAGATSMTSLRVNATAVAPGFATVAWAFIAVYAPCS